MYLSFNTRKRIRYLFSLVPLGVFVMFVFFWPVIRPGLAIVSLPVMGEVGVVVRLITLMPETVRTFFIDRARLVEERDALTYEVEITKNKLESSESKRRDLEHLLLVATGTEGVTHTAILHPVMRDITFIHDTMLFASSKSLDVSSSTIVYVSGRIAIGTVDSHSFTAVTVRPFASAGRIISAFLEKTDFVLSLQGQGDGSYIAEVPQSLDISEGSVVRLLEDTSFELGRVIKVEASEQDMLKTIYVQGGYSLTATSYAYLDEK